MGLFSFSFSLPLLITRVLGAPLHPFPTTFLWVLPLFPLGTALSWDPLLHCTLFSLPLAQRPPPATALLPWNPGVTGAHMEQRFGEVSKALTSGTELKTVPQNINNQGKYFNATFSKNQSNAKNL